MSRPVFFILFILFIGMIAGLSEILQRPSQRCVVDSNTIEPITKVVITQQSGEELQFCSLCCAHQWLDGNPATGKDIAAQKAFLTVVDEISGEILDGLLAYWVESESYSRRENKCRVHVFKNEQDAASHIRLHGGKELPGYLAGLGQHLSWAEPFTAIDLQGREQHLIDFRGKVVFLRFWNSGNPFTATDLGDLQRAQVRFQEQGFIVIAVNVEEDAQAVAGFTKNLGISYPILLDPDGIIADRYGVSGYPTGFLIDRSGIIANRVIGELPPEVMEPLLYPLW